MPSTTIAGTFRPVAPNQRSRIRRILQDGAATGPDDPVARTERAQRFGDTSPHMPGLSQGE